MNCPTQEEMVQAVFAADMRVLEHAAACGSCRAEFAAWRAVVSAAQTAAGQLPASGGCPNENTFAEYVDGVLPAAARTAFEGHVACCTSCVRQLIETREIMDEVAGAPKPHRIVLAWLQEGLKVLSAPENLFRPMALAPVPVLRAAPGTQALAWELEEVGHTLRITVLPGAEGLMTLHLAAACDGEAKPGPRVWLRQAGQLLESMRLDEDGAAVFFGLEPGAYTVEFGVAGETIGVELEVGTGN